jgi:VanZ family protein
VSGYRPGVVLHVAPAVVYVACVFVVGLLPRTPEAPPIVPYFDKVAHFVVFGLMQWVLLKPVRFMWSERSLDWQLRWTLLVVVMLGAVLELAQSLTPTRSMEMLDWVADSLGALLVALLLRGGSHLPEPR